MGFTSEFRFMVSMYIAPLRRPEWAFPRSYLLNICEIERAINYQQNGNPSIVSTDCGGYASLGNIQQGLLCYSAANPEPSKKHTTGTMKVESKPRKRRIQERTEITRDKLKEAALRLFSERGFDGVTIRDIEIKAGDQRGSLSYHFDSKDTLWKIVIDELFGLLKEHLTVRGELLQELPPRERVAYIIRTYVRFAAQHPELNRLMVQEGKKDDWRLHYIADNHTKPAMSGLQQLVQQGLGISEKKFIHWYYSFVGTSGLIFSVSPEVQATFGVDPANPDFVEEHAQFLIDCLVGGKENRW